jgi:hypothetical protein
MENAMHPLTDYIPTVIFIAAAVAIPSDRAKIEVLSEQAMMPVVETKDELEVRLWGPVNQSSELFDDHTFVRAVDDSEYAYAFEEAYRRWLETGLEPAQ